MNNAQCILAVLVTALGGDGDVTGSLDGAVADDCGEDVSGDLSLVFLPLKSLVVRCEGGGCGGGDTDGVDALVIVVNMTLVTAFGGGEIDGGNDEGGRGGGGW